MKEATINLFHDRRTGADTLKLCVTFDRKQRYYSTGYKVDEKTFGRIKDNAFKPKPDGKIKDEDFLALWNALFVKNKKKPGVAVYAQSIVEQLGPNFTFDSFKDLLDNHGKDPEAAPADATGLLNALSRKEARLIAEDRISTGAVYGLVGKSLKRFVQSLTAGERKEFRLSAIPKRSKKPEPAAPLLRFMDITPAFLEVYEQWMTSDQGNSLTTVGIYCRHLRAVFNDAIGAGVIPAIAYPFSNNQNKQGFVIPAGQNPKKALSKKDVDRIKAYACRSDIEQRGRDLWVFSYLCYGMNFADLCKLRWGNVDLEEQTLTFDRQKTARKRKGNQEMIRVVLKPESVTILERWGTADHRPNAFVFPFLSDAMNARQVKTKVQQIVRVTNKYVRLIAEDLGIKGDVTTYSARHSFATILLQSEVPIAFISQRLGHTDVKTTENYLGSFEDEQTRRYLENL